MKHLFGCVAIIVLLFTSKGQAQDTSAAKVKVGIGVSVNAGSLFIFSDETTLFLPLGFSNFTVPIAFRNFRIEPEIGIFSYSNERKSGSSSNKDKQSIVRLGLGLLYTHSFGDQSQFYVGPRFGILMNSSTDESTSSPTREQSSTNISIGGAIGGEYFFSTHFSLGAELQLNYISVGDVSQTPEPDPTFSSEETSSFIANNASLLVKWYFN